MLFNVIYHSFSKSVACLCYNLHDHKWLANDNRIVSVLFFKLHTNNFTFGV